MTKSVTRQECIDILFNIMPPPNCSDLQYLAACQDAVDFAETMLLGEEYTNNNARTFAVVKAAFKKRRELYPQNEYKGLIAQ